MSYQLILLVKIGSSHDREDDGGKLFSINCEVIQLWSAMHAGEIEMSRHFNHGLSPSSAQTARII
jgi:hypothetical protein